MSDGAVCGCVCVCVWGGGCVGRRHGTGMFAPVAAQRKSGSKSPCTDSPLPTGEESRKIQWGTFRKLRRVRYDVTGDVAW
jgi:hypothetical protein